MKKSIISIGAGGSQVPIIKAIKSLGYSAIVVDKNQHAEGVALSDVHICESTYSNGEKVWGKVQELQKEYNVEAVLCRSSGPALETYMYIQKKINQNHLNVDILKLSTEKSVLRKFCEKNEIDVPQGCKLRLDSDFDFNYPVIVKPDYPLYGKKNISVIWNESDISQEISLACDASDNGYAEVETFIDGIDVSVLCLFRQNNAHIITAWDELVGVKKDGSIIGLGVSIPSVVNKGSMSKIKNVLDKICQLQPNLDGLYIMSFRINQMGDPFLIEIHSDLGGDMIAEVLFKQANSNLNYFHFVLNVFLKRNIEQDIAMFNDFKPTALLYAKSRYGFEDNSEHSHLIIQAETLEELKDSLKNYWSRCIESIRLFPQHFDEK